MTDNKVQVGEMVPVLSKIAENKLNGTNYLDWSKTIRIYMRSIDKDDHLSSDPPTDDTKRLWLREDARLILQIRNSIDSEILGLINHCEFVKELMDYLEFLYSGKGNISRIYDVCRAFYRPEKETKTLIAFFMDFKKTYEELNMLLPFSKDIKVQQAQREQMAAMSFLGALPPEFDTAKSQILSGTDITSLQEDLMTKQTIGKGHNGVAERKNRHLLETARALLFQMKVPKPFWADAISTACFLINRMPSTVLNGDVPYSVLFPTKPLFPVEPRIFGSTCFVRDVRPHLTKLDPKALKCVFLGYSRLQKGYRCYSPDLHKYLVSTDVVFSEHSQFFSSNFHSSSKGEDDDWLMYEMFPLVPIAPAIFEDRTCEDGLYFHGSVPVEPSNATDVANSGVAQSEDVNCLGEQAIIPSAPVKPPIVQVYSRRREHHDTCPAPIPSSSDPPSNDLDLPIGLRKETGKAGAKPCNTPMNPSVHLTKDDGDRLDDLEKYKRLVGKLNYLIVTRPDIAYAEEIRFMINPELIAGMLFLPSMADNEAIEIVGAERFSNYVGYASSFRFCGDYVDKRDVDYLGRRKTRIIAIDALITPGKRQYGHECLLREINKAFCGFFDDRKRLQYKRLFQDDEPCLIQLDQDVKGSNSMVLFFNPGTDLVSSPTPVTV
ncbi:hypothetical protein RJ640_018048 [Escallonia rubra]|uniref:Uncharacterized protein n=1 Tax=Escallonia rubra TaxID=112253 RepID=A0AA88R9H3_9ASTE|nr:hypothetical protein RJ640_018048 [Escallonia rubra]